MEVITYKKHTSKTKYIIEAASEYKTQFFFRQKKKKAAASTQENTVYLIHIYIHTYIHTYSVL